MKISSTVIARVCCRFGFLLLLSLIVGSAARAQELSYTATTTRERTTTVNQRKVFVRSKALLVKASVVEDKLMKRNEFAQMGLVLTRDEADADIILELRHDLLTKYVYSAVDARTQTVLAGGKVSSLGGTVAGKVAKRFLKQLAQGHP
ncbi:MAG TPA: hypothetical protein VN696_12770 [Pyrinomonadaceae bacterium]|nr:hypothetical protein [Pyrinomonadaceae bacterium]